MTGPELTLFFIGAFTLLAILIFAVDQASSGYPATTTAIEACANCGHSVNEHCDWNHRVDGLLRKPGCFFQESSPALATDGFLEMRTLHCSCVWTQERIRLNYGHNKVPQLNLVASPAIIMEYPPTKSERLVRAAEKIARNSGGRIDLGDGRWDA